MKINKIDDGYVTLTLNGTELVDVCNSLYRYKERKERTNIIYANLMMARDLSKYGHIDESCFERIMHERGYNISRIKDCEVQE